MVTHKPPDVSAYSLGGGHTYSPTLGQEGDVCWDSHQDKQSFPFLGCSLYCLNYSE